MSFNLRLTWEASEGQDTPEGQFSRDHLIHFGSGQSIRASSAPQYQGNGERVNPEEGLLAALCSCHMLTFLAIAHIKRLTVSGYVDEAYAELGKNKAGRAFVSKIILSPRVTFAEGTEVDEQLLAKIHAKAHDNCFIANSLSSETKFEIA